MLVYERPGEAGGWARGGDGGDGAEGKGLCST